MQSDYVMIASFENFKKLIYLKDQGIGHLMGKIHADEYPVSFSKSYLTNFDN